MKENFPEPIIHHARSPLDIPEVLAKVFSNLTRRQIQNHVLPVCKSWNVLGHAAIPCINTWSQPKASQCMPQVEQLLNSGTDILRCVAPEVGPNTRISKECWSTLEAALNKLPELKRKQIKTVLIRGSIVFAVDLYPILPICCNIQVLRLQNLSDSNIQMDTILRLCPHLLELYINAKDRGRLALNALSFENPDKPLPDLKLRYLVLLRLSVDITLLEQVLVQCPDLQELKLIQMDYPQTSFEVTPEVISVFFNRLASSCPRLQSLHFSSPSVPLTLDLFANILIAFPHLKTWSSEATDMEPFIYKHLRENLPQHLTTLDVMNNRIGAQKYGLHKFLCVASNLLHLTIDGTELTNQDINVLNDILPTKDSKRYRIWACRNLRTLSITFRNEVATPEERYINSRALFSYIVNVCPKLTELQLHHAGLDFSLQSGFCLLSGLERLQELSVSSIRHFARGITKKDFEWFSTEVISSKTSSFLQRQRNKYSFEGLKSSKESIVDRKRFSSTAGEFEQNIANNQLLDPNDEMIYQIQKASCLENVADLLHELQERQDRCWPSLQSIWFSWLMTHKMKNNLPELIKQVRPELDHDYIFACSKAEEEEVVWDTVL
ncbi:hypothetical protein BGZ49_007980 [Haplosporangium sp. Z 27]|nr:hypothetical protein BGZ49_007980 [Haplosporangium sp. Z 27]